MSTYYPKTLKRWKAHKRSVQDLVASPRDRIVLRSSPQAIARSQIIHSLDAGPLALSPPRLPNKERYRLEDNRSKSTHLSSGFRKLRKEVTNQAFSKVVSQQHFIRVDLGSESIHQRSTAGNYLPKMKMIPRSKKLLLVRNQVRRKAVANGVFKDLLQVKQSSKLQHGEVLQTDEEQGDLHLLEEQGFSPYRVRKLQKTDESPTLLSRPIHQRFIIPQKPIIGNKKEDLTSDSIPNFMSINEIDLKAKQERKKGRSLSVMQFKVVQRLEGNEQNRFLAKREHFEVQSWQIEQW